jgi:hypothetical protein
MESNTFIKPKNRSHFEEDAIIKEFGFMTFELILISRKILNFQLWTN